MKDLVYFAQKEITMNKSVCCKCGDPRAVSVNEHGPARFYCAGHLMETHDGDFKGTNEPHIPLSIEGMIDQSPDFSKNEE